MLDVENTYGINKRLEFVAKAVQASAPSSILDLGCGAGTYLTHPVAARFPGIRVVGVDSDEASIVYARQTFPLPNLEFCRFDQLRDGERFDMVIASEVIEHVEDPVTFLADIRARLNPDGVLLLTMPNGYGPFEIMQFAQAVLALIGLPALLRRLAGRDELVGEGAKDTLADSPHINFFSFARINALIAGAGFRVLEYRPRTFLCGWGIDRLLRGRRLLEWNARISERLPVAMASAWMFILAPAEPVPDVEYRRGAYARLRRYLNERSPARQAVEK